MQDEELLTTVREVIAEIGEFDEPDAIDPDQHLIEDLELDSMLLLEVLASLERLYGITIPEKEFPNMTTISRCTEVVKRHMLPEA